MIKRGLGLAGAILLSALASAQGFTQKELEAMVREIEAVAIKNDKYAYPIECELVEDEDINAGATAYDTEPGKKPQAYIVVFSGLVKHVKGDKRLLRAVIAHEVAHLAMGHCRRNRFIAKDFENIWTRQQELEADKVGLSYLMRLGYPKKDMLDMLMALESIDGRAGGWLGRLTADHPDPKARAAELSDDPSTWRAMVQFDAGLAFMDCRRFGRAGDLFKEAYELEPRFTEAYVNEGQARLMDYWDNLSQSIVNTYYRIDFGPLLTHIVSVRGKETVITAEDRERYDEAIAALQNALKKTGSERVKELLAIAKIVNPDRNAVVIQQGVDEMMKLRPLDADEAFRYANNAAVGLLALKKVDQAYSLLIAEWRKGETGSDAGAENLARIDVPGRNKEDEAIAAGVYEIFLKVNSQAAPAYAIVRKAYEKSCAALGTQPKVINPAPIYLTQVAGLVHDGKAVDLFDTVDKVVSTVGIADVRTLFSKTWSDMFELRWNEGRFAVWAERGRVLRATSKKPGSYLLFKPVDTTIRQEYRVTVGMPVTEFERILSLEGAELRELASESKTENWHYYPGLNMGVLVESGKVAGITVTAIKAPPPAP